MLPIMGKLNGMLRLKFENTWEFLYSLGKELKVMMILPLRNTFYSAVTHLVLEISYFLLPTTAILKLRQWRLF